MLEVHGNLILVNKVKMEVNLISSNEMYNNAGVSKVNKPEGFVESKSCQKVSRCIISKGCIPKASATKVEESCDNNGGD